MFLFTLYLSEKKHLFVQEHLRQCQVQFEAAKLCIIKSLGFIKL